MGISKILTSAFIKRTKQEAKQLYYGIILVEVLCLLNAYLRFSSSTFFSSYVYFFGTTSAIVYFHVKILRRNYINSLDYIDYTDAQINGSAEEEEFINSIKYINDKDKNDPENIKRRTITRIATTYFYEGETRAKEMHKSAIAAPIMKMGLASLLIIVCAIVYLSSPYFPPFWCIPVSIISFAYIFFQKREHLIDFAIHNSAHNLSLSWRESFKRRSANERIYNTQGWANKQQTDAAFSSEEGIYIGANYYWNEPGHILTIGSSRAGKGVNLIIPCLLSDGFSASGTSFICLDPKGENASLTANHIRMEGYEVHILNPFQIDGLPNSKFNPFSFIEKDDNNVIEYCDMLAEMIVPMKANIDANTEHFDTQARSILSIFMLHLIATEKGEDKSFVTLFKWANLAGSKLDDLLGKMIKSADYRGIVSSIISGFEESRLSGGEREVSGILSTIRKGLAPFKNFKIQDSTATSDFDLRDIATFKTGIYICLPQSEMDSYAVWLRIVIGCSIKLMQKYYSKTRKVLFIMDEFATLGYMRDFEKNAGYMAGFNVSFWVILQLLPQIQNLYPNIWETFVGNAVIKHFLGIGDSTTAKYVSELMPNIVILNDNGDFVKEKKLLEPTEVMTFPNVLVKYGTHTNPFNLSKMPFYEVGYMKSRSEGTFML